MNLHHTATPDFLSRVPEVILPSRPELVGVYTAAWSIAATRGIRPPHPAVPDGEPYFDACFSDNIFQWDSCFLSFWSRYGRGLLPGGASPLSNLDNFYALQGADGSIAREYRPDGTPEQVKTRAEETPSTPPHARHGAYTNPPLFSWAEWEYFQHTGDDSRLARVLPHLARYFEWYMQNRVRPTGHLWFDSFGSGMDNIDRTGVHGCIDYTCQAALDAGSLASIALYVGDEDIARGASEMYLVLKELINDTMWDDFAGRYGDIDEDLLVIERQHAGVFWALVADVVPAARLESLVRPLRSVREYARRHRLPAIPATEKSYNPAGDYWRGGVWPPIVHTVVRGLERCGHGELAHEIALNHLANVAEVFANTGTLWENYAPDAAAPGKPARPDFCGWSALGPIAILIETVLGISVNGSLDEVTWNLRLEESHGIRRLYVRNTPLNLQAEKTSRGWRVRAEATAPLTLWINGTRGARPVDLRAGVQEVEVE